MNDVKLPLPEAQSTTRTEDLANYGKDWAMYFSANASAVLFPESESDVQTIVKWANDNQVALIPSGGRTGLSSAATATNLEVIVSFDRMNQILDYNEVEHIVRVQPGVITEALHEFATKKGRHFPIDFAAKGSSQIAGNVATNAGGVKVLRYGLMRNWITGLKVVTGSGETLHLNKSLRKNAVGYDLRHLFIGSEGTLGFITEVEVQLAPAPPEHQVLVLGLQQLEDVLPVYKSFNDAFDLSACEFFDQLSLDNVLSQHDLEKPFEQDVPFYLLVELEKTLTDFDERLEEVFSTCFEKEWLVDGVISQTSEQKKNFWSLREFISESISPQKPYKNDVSVRPTLVPEFVSKASALLKQEYPDFDVVWFGHIGDGNVHINILKPKDMDRDDFVQTCKKSDPHLYGLLKDLGGSISAEHGVGLIKKPFLNYSLSEAEIEIFRQIKKIFDPKGIMNPGKIFDQ